MIIKIINAHPEPKDSTMNNQILKEVKKQDKKNEIEIKTLIDQYPNYKIDITKEQEWIKDADILVF